MHLVDNHVCEYDSTCHHCALCRYDARGDETEGIWLVDFLAFDVVGRLEDVNPLRSVFLCPTVEDDKLI